MTANDHHQCELSLLTFSQLQTLIREFLPDVHLNVSSRRKSSLVEALLKTAPPSTLQALYDAAQRYLHLDAEVTSSPKTRKRKCNDEDIELERRTKRRVQQDPDKNQGTTTGGPIEPLGNETKFMELPGDEQTQECYREFYLATDVPSLVVKTCGVCAREVNIAQMELTELNLRDIPNVHRLWPVEVHEAHSLYSGCLLEPSGVKVEADNVLVSICGECIKELSKTSNLPPRHSLANNLWVGPIPWELSQLTVPEQMLIALLYPRVFVYKLSNKTWYQQDQKTLQ
jgi:hypothetical protein